MYGLPSEQHPGNAKHATKAPDRKFSVTLSKGIALSKSSKECISHISHFLYKQKL